MSEIFSGFTVVWIFQTSFPTVPESATFTFLTDVTIVALFQHISVVESKSSEFIGEFVVIFQMY